MSNDGLVLRFDAFEFDPQRLTLSRSGVPVSLKRQSAEVLRLLLKSDGAVVTRDEIRDQIWVGRTIEFDDGINAAIRDIRRALADDASAPRFVETHPKLGYRFLLRVKQKDRDFARLRIRALAAVGIVALGIAALGMTSGLGRDSPGDLDRLAVMPLRVIAPHPATTETADAWTRSMVRELVAGQERVQVISAGELFGEDRPDPSMADMTRWLEADYLLASEIYEAEDGPHISLRLIRTDGYVHLWTTTLSLDEESPPSIFPFLTDIVDAVEGA